MAKRVISILFYTLLAFLIIDAAIEMAFVSATVAFLHRRAGGSFQITYSSASGGSFSLHGKPAHLLVDQGHTSNGAAGTALILVGVGGLLTFPFLGRDAKKDRLSVWSRIMTIFWPIVSILSTLLTLAALIYTFVITKRHDHQTISLTVASRLNNRPYPNYVAYPLNSWTPQNWFAAVLRLPLASASDRSLIRQKYRVMVGWEYNLIPMFLLGLATSITGIKYIRTQRAEMKRSTPSFERKSVEREMSDDGHHAGSPMLEREI